MYRIIDKKCSGKTSRLLLLAKESNGIVVCKDPEKMREKAYAYGLTGIDFISYWDFLADSVEDFHQDIFIDELDDFLSTIHYTIKGYTISNED